MFYVYMSYEMNKIPAGFTIQHTSSALCMNFGVRLWSSKPYTSGCILELHLVVDIPTFWMKVEGDFEPRVFERLVFPMHSLVKECWVLCARGSFVVSWLSEAPDGEFFSETKYFGSVNVLDTTDTDGNFKCRINKSLYERRVSDFFYTRCFNICFTFFIILF